MRTVVALACAALSLMACEPFGEAVRTGPGIAAGAPWAMACSFTDAERADIRAGLAMWPAGTLGAEQPCVERGQGVRGVLVDQGELTAEGHDVYGGADGDTAGGTIWLTPGWQAEPEERRRRATVGHEMGHLLGLGHVADAGCLMHSPAWAEAPCPAELAEVE